MTELEIALVKYDGVDDLAYKALKEMQEREKGCPCCNGFHPDKLGEKIYAWSVHYYEIGNGITNYIESVCCPMCGRKLI